MAMFFLLIGLSWLVMVLMIEGLVTGNLRILRSSARYSRSTQPFWFWLMQTAYALLILWLWYTAVRALHGDAFPP